MPDNFTVPDASAGPQAVLAALRAADWSAFVPDRDLPGLRDVLDAVEHGHGVTDAHRFATARLRQRGGTALRHARPHRTEVNALALSPCGRHLVSGGDQGDDFSDGGTLAVWELATGRCVNVLDRVEGGVGWAGHRDCVQWSADCRLLALAFRTNEVGWCDPFTSAPPVSVAMADGSPRPPQFALSADGRQVFVVDGSDIQGQVVRLRPGSPADGEDAGRLAVPVPEPVRGDSVGHGVVVDGVVWSADGSRLRVHSLSRVDPRRAWVAAVDVAARRVEWFVEVDANWGMRVPAVWSTDGRLVAYVSAGRLVVADATTGTPVEPAGDGHADLAGVAVGLYWGGGRTDPRLAVVTSDGRVSVRDRDGRRHDLDVTAASPDGDLPDAAPWAWAPDGERAACLTAAGKVEVWSSADRPVRLRVLDAAKDTVGVLWGAEDVLVLAGREGLRFVRADDGTTLGDHTFLWEPEEFHPIEVDDLDPDAFTGDPVFALDQDTWAVAFEAGLVVAPDDRADDLDTALTWAVDRRYGWPVRWGAPTVVPDLDAAVDVAGRVDRRLRNLLADLV